MSSTCPFCKPGISSAVFASTDLFSAVYNIAPILPGHSLIVPNRHVTSVLELSDIELQQFILFCRDTTKVLMHIFNSESFNWSLQEKEMAGQTVAHLHWHIVPRYLNDLPEPGAWYPKIEQNSREILDSDLREKLNSSEMYAIVSKLRGESTKFGLFPNESS